MEFSDAGVGHLFTLDIDRSPLLHELEPLCSERPSQKALIRFKFVGAESQCDGEITCGSGRPARQRWLNAWCGRPVQPRHDAYCFRPPLTAALSRRAMAEN